EPDALRCRPQHQNPPLTRMGMRENLPRTSLRRSRCKRATPLVPSARYQARHHTQRGGRQMNIPVAAFKPFRTILATVVFALLLCSIFFSERLVSSANSQADGAFTAGQAARGAAVYAKSCAACHGQRLEGGSSTALVGASFAGKWGDGKHSVDDLYFVIRTQMPYGAAGTLTDQQYLDVVAFMLQSNGSRAGNKMLAANSPSLKTMIAAAPAKPSSEA